MIHKLLLPLGLLALTAVACTGAEEIDEKPAAQVTEPAEPEPKVEEPAAPEFKGTAVSVDAESSKIDWLGAKVTKTHDGGFKKFDGVAYVDGEAVTGADFTIDLASLWSDAEKLTGHLQGEDFFNVAEFAEAKFVSTKVVEKAAEGATHEVTGELDLHGVKKEITFPATIAVAADSVKVTSEFQINRMDWDIKYPGKPDDLIKEEVAIKLDLSFPREAAAAGEEAPAGAPAPSGAAAAPGGTPSKAAPKTEAAPTTGTATKGGDRKGASTDDAKAPAPTGGATKGGSRK